jgi:alanyl-tRNA synthetase
MDAGKLLKSALEARGGRGGGNARSAQGTVRDRADLDPVVAALLAG